MVATIVAMAILLTATVTVILVRAQAVSSNVYLDDLPSTATYTIKTDVTNYWAVRYDGKQLWASTNVSYTMQSAIDSMTVGEICFLIGEYSFLTPVTVKSYIRITGEGYGSLLKLADNANCSIFVSDNSSVISGFELSNINLHGNRNNQQVANPLVHLYNPRRCDITACRIQQSKGDGILLEGTETYLGYFNQVYGNDIDFNDGDGVEIIRADENFILHNHFNADKGIGIYSRGGTDRIIGNVLTACGESVPTAGAITVTDRNNAITSNHIDSSYGIGIMLYGSYFGNEVVGNTIGNCSRDGIVVHGMTHFGVIGNTVQDPNYSNGSFGGIRISNATNGKFADNTIHDTRETNLMKWGIIVPSDSTTTDSIELLYNTVTNYTVSSIQLDAGTNFTLRGNTDFATENSVAFSSVSNGTYVAHGLAGTPDYVQVTLSVGGYTWYGSLNSTHVQLYANVATLNGTMYCIYEP